MQKFIITDGKRYIYKTNNGKYSFKNSSMIADKFTYKQGENIIKNHLKGDLKKVFYLEGVEDFKRVDINNVEKEKTAVSKDNRFKFDESIIQRLDKLAETVALLNIPNLNNLIAMRSDLESANQFYDKALSDIDHWIMNHTPPANIRTKVYGVQHDIENIRKDVKEKWAYVNILIRAREENYTFDKLQKEMINAKWKAYTPNTYIYDELEALVKR